MKPRTLEGQHEGCNYLFRGGFCPKCGKVDPSMKSSLLAIHALQGLRGLSKDFDHERSIDELAKMFRTVRDEALEEAATVADTWCIYAGSKTAMAKNPMTSSFGNAIRALKNEDTNAK